VTFTRAAQDYRLCGLCAEREGEGVEESVLVQATDCYICEGLMAKIHPLAQETAQRISRYQFESFAVGLSMPEGVQEREDELRADLKLKGRETIRTQASRLIAEEVASLVGRRVDRARPDLTAVIDVTGGGVVVSSKPLFFYGRYTKPPGISQRRELCGRCSGRGCNRCRMTGFEQAPSVEGQLRKRLAKACGSDRMKFTWIGSEDRESRVYPPGRPFVVELKNPVKRVALKRFTTRAKGGLVTVSRGRMLLSRPTSLPSFRFRTLIRATTKKAVNAESLAEVSRRFRRTEVRFDRPHERPTSKMVYMARAKKRGRTVTIEAILDGGLPVKRFVSGELVSPSVSEVLKAEVRCRTFDICEVKETGEFGFAKITRV
jgi:tRNA pseudouridine synthase 10